MRSLDEVRLTPLRSALSNERRAVSLETMIGGVAGKPLILLGEWDVDSARYLAETSRVFVAVSPFDLNDLSLAHERFFLQVSHKDIDALTAIRSDDPLRIRLDLSDCLEQDPETLVREWKEAYPSDFIIAGPCMDSNVSLWKALGADLVEVGAYDAEASLVDYVEEMTGARPVIPDDMTGCVASVGCRSTADVVRCLALGASLVALSSEFSNVDLVARGIEMGVLSAGGDDISSISSMVMRSET